MTEWLVSVSTMTVFRVQSSADAEFTVRTSTALESIQANNNGYQIISSIFLELAAKQGGGGRECVKTVL